MSTLIQKAILEFGPFRLDPVKRLLFRDGETVQLAPKALDTLLVLVEAAGQVVDKAEIMKRVWPDTFVEEINLTVNISALRKVLGEGPNDHLYIVTVPRRGYSFVADVREWSDDRNGQRTEDQCYSEGAVGDNNSIYAPAGNKSGIQSNESGLASHPSTEAAGKRPTGKPALKSVAAVLTLGLLIALCAIYAVIYWNRQPKPAVAKSMAVLPFKYIGAQDQSDLELGMADALITRLSRLDQISLRPTSAVFRYTGETYDPARAGRELRVDAVMQGTIQEVDARVRVTVQLIRVSDGAPVWADHFDEKRSNILAMQDSISEQVARALSLKLGAAEERQLRTHATENTGAYHAYLKGIYFWKSPMINVMSDAKRADDSLKRGIEYFREATELDPNYALAYSGLADAAILLYSHSPQETASKEYFERAKAAATKAVDLQESLPEAHIAKSWVLLYDNDSAGAEREQRRALELAPNSPMAHQSYAWILFLSGQLERAAQEMDQAVELDPLSIANHVARASFLYYLKRYDECIEESTNIMELDSAETLAFYFRGLAYEQKGQYDPAIEDIFRSSGSNGEDQETLEALGHVYAVSGRKAKARETIQKLTSLAEKDHSAGYSIALVYAGIGDKDRVFQWLGRAAGYKTSTTLCVDPRFDNIRLDPRYEHFLPARGATG